MADLSKARRLAREGHGWEDVKVECGLTEAEARYLILGREHYMRWKAKAERKAS